MNDQQLIENARDLAPLIKARSAESERLRKPHDENIRQLTEAGIIQMLVPRKWGGSEAGMETMLEVVKIISRACVSTGWVTSFYINHNVYVAKFGQQVQQEIFGNRGFTLLPAANAPTMKARQVDGGWVVSGRAPWGSGIMHADWAMVTGTWEGGSRVFLLPAADVGVDDVWHFTGMAATGSNDMVLDEVFVPEHRSIDDLGFKTGPTEDSLQYENPLYSLPILPLAYNTVSGVIVGGFAGALDEFSTIMEKRVRNFSGAVVREQPQSHIALGEAQMTSRMASDLARLMVAETLRDARREPFPLARRLDLKARIAFISKICLDGANAMMARSGSSNFHLDQPIQRYWRDLNTVCSHAFWDWDATRELLGREMLGLKPNHPLA